VNGDTSQGEDLLLAARDRWSPFTGWDVTPYSAVLQPTLRLVVTDRVREYYLTRPLGPRPVE
jgi:hypothetical protein